MQSMPTATWGVKYLIAFSVSPLQGCAIIELYWIFLLLRWEWSAALFSVSTKRHSIFLSVLLLQVQWNKVQWVSPSLFSTLSPRCSICPSWMSQHHLWQKTPLIKKYLVMLLRYLWSPPHQLLPLCFSWKVNYLEVGRFSSYYLLHSCANRFPLGAPLLLKGMFMLMLCLLGS